jgi:membrane protein implicated in regulation of membrane protease activity
MPEARDLEPPDWPKSGLEELRGGAIGVLVGAALAVVLLWFGAYSLAKALDGSSTWQFLAVLSVPVAAVMFVAGPVIGARKRRSRPRREVLDRQPSMHAG